ncbi:MAG TPA: SHOCT domain-containing protein [Candidatus Krumholzibacteria bacterium]|nr:SHOCT domain-containing protein [Candidatus Krumholzibacteria bacterium]
MWYWHSADMGWGWWIVGPLMMLLFWGGVIWLLFALFSGRRRDSDVSRGSRFENPREIAKRRLASGEITEAEYDRIISKLSDGQ